MLLSFSASNYRSICEEQVVSLVASSLSDNKESLIPLDKAPKLKALPALVIYGANASGKTTVLRALRFICEAVLFSHRKGDPEGGVPLDQFRLSPDNESPLSKFEIDFTINKVRYHYGFTASSDEFVEEWLYYFPNNRQVKLFERNGKSFSFGRNLKGGNNIIRKLTRNNSLFLSCAMQNDHDLLSDVGRFFSGIEFSQNISVDDPLAASNLAHSEVDLRVLEFLAKIGTGIVAVATRDEMLSESDKKLSEEIVEAVKRHKHIEIEKREKRSYLQLIHSGFGGKRVPFEFVDESSGTQRLLVLLSTVFNCLDNGTVLSVDELDASLHTLAYEEILKLFLSKSTNPNGAQIIATTHDTSVLQSRDLRRDQIWFSEKDSTGATHVFPLTDIRTRKGDNIERGYLQGRFGAIPFSSGMKSSATF